ILDHSGAQLCIVTPDLEETIAPLKGELEGLSEVIAVGDGTYDDLFTGQPIALEHADPDGTAWLFYTSGTTGRPKGAMLTHRVLMTMVLSYFADIDSVSEYDCMIHAAPMSHGSGLYSLPILAKGGNQVFPISGHFD